MTTAQSSGPADFAAAAQALSAAFAGGQVDFARLHEVVDTMVPFATFTGVRLVELTRDGAVAEIPDDPRYLNHLGTVHAGALFLASEVACAGAFAGVIAPRLAELRFFVLRSSKVWFLNAGQGRVRVAGTIATADAVETRTEHGERQVELTGTAMVRGAGDLLLARISFDYLAVLA